jgi:hypothetical protein
MPPIGKQFLVILILKMEAICYSEEMLPNDKAAQFCSLEYHNLTMSYLFAPDLFNDAFTSQITKA